MFEKNTLIASTTITGSGVGAWNDLGDGGPLGCMNLLLLATAMAGNANVVFKIQTSDDQVSIFDVAQDEFGAINVLSERVIRWFQKRRYWRLAWTWNGNNTGGGSGNSSSLSAQSFNSSSSGGSAWLTFQGGLTPSITG